MYIRFSLVLRLILLLVLINIFLTNFLLVCLPGEIVPIKQKAEGGFFLATVAMGPANLWSVLYALFAPEANVIWDFAGHLNNINELEESQRNAYLVAKNCVTEECKIQSLLVPDTVKGGSGGLIFALAYYEQCVNLDLSNGLRISGSGTLTQEGLIKPVQAIKQKVLAANEQQVDIFFVHPENFHQAKAANSEMLIVPVTSFLEALSFLLDTNKQSLYNL